MSGAFGPIASVILGMFPGSMVISTALPFRSLGLRFGLIPAVVPAAGTVPLLLWFEDGAFSWHWEIPVGSAPTGKSHEIP